MERLSDLRYCTAQSLTFSTFSKEEIKKLSSTKVITSLSFNSLGHALAGGLYDPALGPVDYNGQCSTCKLKLLQCPGHMGHIELPLPVINPLYNKIIINILKLSCINCFKVLIPSSIKTLVICQLKLLEKGYFFEASEMEIKFSNLIADWDKGKDDIASGILASTTMEQYLEEVLLKRVENNQEVKGEGDLRNSFIKKAISHLFKGKRCPFCSQVWRCITVVNNKILINQGKIQVADKFNVHKKSNTDASMFGYSYVTPKECREYLLKIWVNDAEIMKVIAPMLKYSVETNPIDSFFLTNLFVTPSNSRPVHFMNGIITEHPQSIIYKAILNDCLVIKSIILVMNNNENKDSLSDERMEVIGRIRGKDYTEKLQYVWQELQSNVDSLLDIDMKKVHRQTGIGLKQIIEKKQGIFRMNMMGKRVNYAARTVITPDPNLNIDEIGVPEDFAKKLTYPAPVTVWNVTELRKLVMNGPNVHPGANLIEDENRRIFKISGNDSVAREGLAKRLLTPGEKVGFKIVHRHLINGDILLLNRQPTLHRPSIMAHKARVLKGEKTFRLHYANCKSYNADFDGDEMNAHFPQNEVARSEGYNIVSVSSQYLVPKDGTPLSGLIQDYMVSGVRLSVRGKMFTKSEYMQLVFQGLSSKHGDIKTLKPCILKPVELWSGKQIISTLIINTIPEGQVLINLSSKAKISCKAWLRGPPRKWESGGTPFSDEKTMSEEEVIIRQGELLCGVLDKTHYGATPYGLVHCMYELYGGDVSSFLLSSLAKLFTAFLQTEGFTLGVEDILVLKGSDKKRSKLIKSARKIGDEIVSKVIEVPTNGSLNNELAQKHAKDPLFRSLLDHTYKTSLDKFTNEINKTCIPNGLLRPFPSNNLQLMVQSGAKGSTVNTMQISCLLGQIELEGKRPPLMVSGKSLPSFVSYDTSPRAGGFVDGRFLTGIKPQEFFFHCMAGREGLIDTAVKTSRSGYLQRCLVKHLEGLNVHYDMTVRDSDGSVVQFLYGEDGMEVTKCKFLNENQLPFLLNNFNAVCNEDVMKVFKETTNVKTIRTCNKQVKKWKDVAQYSKTTRKSAFLSFCNSMTNKVEGSSSINPAKGRTYSSLKLCKLWNKLSAEDKLIYEETCLKTPDPVVSRFQPDRHYGSITENMDLLINNYMKQHEGEIKEKRLRNIICEKFASSLCPPGEPVGLLAAQSVGEPSTQMTLNTFHFAGRGEMNVTLGIPRLREILMVASRNIKTPSIVIPFKDVPNLEHQVNKLRRKMTRITLADVLESISVHEKLQLSPSLKQMYILKMLFLPHEAYKENTAVTPKQILKYVEKKFLKNLMNNIKPNTKKAKEMIVSEAENATVKAADDDNEEEGAEDETKKKKTATKVGIADDYESSEDEPEGDDDDATTARRRARQQEEQQYSDLEDDASIQEEITGEGVEVGWELEEVDEKEEEKSDSKVKTEELGRKSLVTRLECVSEYKYDTLKEQWCEVTLSLPMNFGRIDISSMLRVICHSSIVHEIPGIKRAIVQSERTGTAPLLRTEGLNMAEIYSYDKILDLNRLYTNDIHAMAQTYGIEAATRVIVKEVQDVFKVYGITVDPRHLNLIADYMTFSGVYLSLSRKGLEGGASPLQQMSFEASLGFLKSAVLREKRDDLSSPSSRLMLGAPVKNGTGSFRLLQRITV